MQDYSILVSFLRCYFQSELYPTDLLGASKQCVLQYDSEAAWETILQCSQDDATLTEFARTLLEVQNKRPTFEQTPHIFLNEQYSSLAGVDLKKALCRVTVSSCGDDPFRCNTFPTQTGNRHLAV